MTQAQVFNEDQRTRWNGMDGEYWTSNQDRLDRTLAPVTGPLLAFAAPRAGSTVIDVGCGCGATTIEIARAVGPSGRVVGIDVSGPMLALAAERLREFANTTCLAGDAAELPLSDLKAELIVSRFGVMFFGDPVAAFANLRTGLAAGGRVRFACCARSTKTPGSRFHCTRFTSMRRGCRNQIRKSPCFRVWRHRANYANPEGGRLHCAIFHPAGYSNGHCSRRNP